MRIHRTIGRLPLSPPFSLESRHPNLAPVALALTIVLLPSSLAVTLTPLTGFVIGGGSWHGKTPYVNSTLQVGASLGTHYADRFYEVVLTDDGLPTSSLQRIGDYLNTTPISMVRFGGVGEGYDPTTQTNYMPPTSGVGRYVPTSMNLWNLTWFKGWCTSRTPTCDWLGYLPGEENNTQAAIHFAKWYHSVYGLTPTYWEFGNEPTQWTHFGLNMTRWSTTDTAKPTATDYATMVHNYIAAVSSIYPNDQFIGLEAACACNRLQVSETAYMDGARLSALAYHSYPSNANSSTQLSAFYDILTSAGNISATSAKYRGGISLTCTTCAGIPVELGEYQAGPFSAPSPFAAQYPGAPFLAASLIEAMQANISTWSVYNTDSLMNSSSGAISAEGYLFQRILSNMTMGTDYPVTVSARGVGGLFSLLIENGTRSALLVVNTNITVGLYLAVPFALFPVGGAGSVYAWSPFNPVPTHTGFLALPHYYAVPPQGILLLTDY
jgi:hypothetical protein